MANKTVLLVDDEPLLLNSTGRMLESQFDVFSATNGRAAFDICQQVHIDCAVIDVTLGDMNGFELVSIMRSNGKKLPVIMVSGGGFELYQSMIHPLAISHCFQKPYELDDLMSMINNIVV